MLHRIIRFNFSKGPRLLGSTILLLLLNGFFPAIAFSQTAHVYSTKAYFYHNDYLALTTMNVRLSARTTEPTGGLKFNYRARKRSRNRPYRDGGAITVYMASTRISSISLSGQTATVQGDGTVNGASGYSFTATITDKARRRGTGADTFGITITGPGGYSFAASGTLAGGDLLVAGAAPPDTTAPTVAITSPQNLITVGSSPIAVSGTIDDPTATLTVNGVPAPITNGRFSVSGITLTEGMNTIVARAIDSANNVATASVNISLDSTPPQMAIASPPDGYRATASPITVTGIINDIVRGTVNETQGRVLVNGIAAGISNRNFIVEAVPLNPGPNLITAVGSDQGGNTRSVSITVHLDTTPRTLLRIVSGNNQSGPIGSSLLNPLAVQVVNDAGAPVAGTNVIFRVIENNGTLLGSASGRAIAVTTDAAGQAQATWTLGTWAGSGNNRVAVTATGVEGSVLFTASGLQKPPAAIYVAQGSQQRGAINHLLPEPLVAFVTDEGHNPLGGVPVIFKTVEGGGHFPNGLETMTVNTDSDGRATVAFTLGPTAGNDSQIVGATFEGNTGELAGFTATGLIPGDPGNTRISGVVLDNSNHPIPNVTLRVQGTSREARTDAAGQFVITNVPVGPVHLIADGSTAGTPGVIEYPTLMYELTTISGADNGIGMPIYLLSLDLANAKWVGGDQDVTYTLPGVPGFSLTIKAHSVTFPDGKHEGYISVTQVHADKVPMVPQIGQQPKFIVTIQPPGAIFDPPAALTLPNVDGLAPGAKTNMYSFDHDLGIFVSIGTGTVSEDGLVIVSDPGVGVVKAGWHSQGNPTRTGRASNCGECGLCIGLQCLPADDGTACGDNRGQCSNSVCIGGVCIPRGLVLVDGSSCDDGRYCTTPDTCENGRCQGTQVPSRILDRQRFSLGFLNVILARIQDWARLFGNQDLRLPVVTGEVVADNREVCCERRQGQMTLESIGGGNFTLPMFETAEVRPQFPPWTGDYVRLAFGRAVGIRYGIAGKATIGSKARLTRVERTCESDTCWSGVVEVEAGFKAGLFGQVLDPTLPTVCGFTRNKPCSLLKMEGNGIFGLNMQSSVGCDRLTIQVGHQGLRVDVRFVLLEGQWFEFIIAESPFVLYEPGPIGEPLTINLE